MFPSVKTIMRRLSITRDKAKIIRGLIDYNISPFSNGFPKTQAWARACYNPPEDFDVYAVLSAISEVIDGYGVESITSNRYIDNYYQYCCLQYVNMGDTYENTVVYDTERSLYYIMSYGDWVETYEKTNKGAIE